MKRQAIGRKHQRLAIFVISTNFCSFKFLPQGKSPLLYSPLFSPCACAPVLALFFSPVARTQRNPPAKPLPLVDHQPSFISHIRKKHDHAGKTLFEDANAWVALSEIFTNILRDPSLNSTYLIIDALDECVTDLPKLLDCIVQKSSVSPLVKWIVSSRNDTNIERRLRLNNSGTRRSRTEDPFWPSTSSAR